MIMEACCIFYSLKTYLNFSPCMAITGMTALFFLIVYYGLFIFETDRA